MPCRVSLGSVTMEPFSRMFMSLMMPFSLRLRGRYPMPRLTRHGIIQVKEQLAQFGKQKKELRIKMGKETDSITSLSGGNQQKVVLAKWLSANPSLLILDNPTQGVDVGAKEEIYEIILRLAAQGVAVVVLCSEAQEIIRLCDRALVMYHGTVRALVSGETMNEHEMMRLATGG